MSGAGQAWLMLGGEDDKSRIGVIDAAGFARVIDTLLGALVS